MKRNLKTLTYIIASLLLLSGVFFLGAYAGYSRIPEIEKVLNLTNKNPQTETLADFSPFWKVWNVLSDKSIYSKKVTDQSRVWGAAEGLASSLGDPYTVFFPPEENKLFQEEIGGSFSGIGAEIGIKDKVLTVISPLKNSPAAKFGLKSGDKIVKIDKVSTSDMTVDKAISLIRGPKGSSVILTIFRAGEKETREITITRDDIATPTIETETKGDIFVIKFYTFSANSVNLFKNALVEFTNSKSHKLIIDLRGNPGGYLDAAIDIGSWFIDDGKVIVSEEFGDGRKPNIYRSHGPRIFNDNLSFIVLVDGGSASASEILAGALQEHKIATLVGEQTFGKGSVQELVKITDDTSLKVTIANWLTPNGKSISLKGLEPDVVVPYTLKDFEAKKDPQMEKALEILSAKP